jgi:hypothetical protein
VAHDRVDIERSRILSNPRVLEWARTLEPEQSDLGDFGVRSIRPVLSLFYGIDRTVHFQIRLVEMTACPFAVSRRKKTIWQRSPGGSWPSGKLPFSKSAGIDMASPKVGKCDG